MKSRQSKCGKFVYVAPDGGWGYLIVAAIVINMVIFSIFSNCSEMLYKELFKQIHITSTGVACLKGIFVASHALSGFLTYPILKLTTIRKLALLAALVYSAAHIFTMFVRSQTLLFFYQGIMQGIGSGLLVNLSFTVVIQYFDEKRLLAVGVAHTMSALSTLVSPIVIRWYLEYQGSRATMFFLSGTAMNTILSAMLMQPVSWHMKKIAVPETNELEMKSLISINNGNINKSKSVEVGHSANTTQLSDTGRKEARVFEYLFDGVTNTIAMKKFLMSIAPLGLSLSVFSEMTFIKMLPNALYYMDWNSEAVTWALFLLRFSDVPSGLLVVVASGRLSKFGSRETYVAGLVVAFFARIGMLWSENPTTVQTFLVIVGVSRCLVILLTTLVVAEAVGLEKFTSAYGIVMLMTGVINLVLGPVIGGVRDLTDSYSTVFYILTSCYCIVVMFWCIEILYKKNKHKWTNNKTVLEKY